MLSCIYDEYILYVITFFFSRSQAYGYMDDGKIFLSVAKRNYEGNSRLLAMDLDLDLESGIACLTIPRAEFISKMSSLAGCVGRACAL